MHGKSPMGSVMGTVDGRNCAPFFPGFRQISETEQQAVLKVGQFDMFLSLLGDSYNMPRVCVWDMFGMGGPCKYYPDVPCPGSKCMDQWFFRITGL